MTNKEQNQFKRESRYLVIKYGDLEKLYNEPKTYGPTFGHALALVRPHLPKREFLVIESDWPEYEPTWRAIEARVTGQPTEQDKAQGVVELPDPVAWIKPDVAETLTANECCYAFGSQNPKGDLIPLVRLDTVQPLFDRVQGDKARLEGMVTEGLQLAYDLRKERDEARAENETLKEGCNAYEEIIADKMAERDDLRIRVATLEAQLKFILARHGYSADRIDAALNPPADDDAS